MMAATKHIKKFDQGNRTVQEYHAQFAFPTNAKCQGCGRRPTIRAIVMIPYDEAKKRKLVPDMTLMDWASPAGHQLSALIVQIDEDKSGKPKPYVRTSLTYSCSGCKRNLEKALAKAPSWAIVEINEGPDPTNRILAQV